MDEERIAGPEAQHELIMTLRSSGQERLAALLEGGAPESLRSECAAVDWEEIAALHAAPQAAPPAGSAAAGAEIAAPRVLTLAERAEEAAALQAAGEAAYRAGQVAVLMVAGGQGTRLGQTGPKGCFVITPLGHKSIYQLQAEKVVALQRAYGRPVPLLVMTSPATDAETRRFFAAHGGFGLPEGTLRFFCQGMVPSLDDDGQALLAGPAALLQNPDGHGGCFTALGRSGELARLHAEGRRCLVYIQVDNILAVVDDPLLVGLLVREDAEVITKVLEKADPEEKVGHLVRRGGRDAIIEYTELSAEEVRRRGTDGELIYRWGSPALHCFSVPFLEGLWQSGVRLPLHKSRKPLQAYDPQAGQVRPVVGYKSERFIFDLLPLAQRSLGLAIDRSAEFAPVKNRSGVDSAESAVALATALYGRWLEDLGVKVVLPAGASQRFAIEISPRFAATQAELRRRWDGRFPTVQQSCYLEEP